MATCTKKGVCTSAVVALAYASPDRLSSACVWARTLDKRESLRKPWSKPRRPTVPDPLKVACHPALVRGPAWIMLLKSASVVMERLLPFTSAVLEETGPAKPSRIGVMVRPPAA